MRELDTNVGCLEVRVRDFGLVHLVIAGVTAAVLMLAGCSTPENGAEPPYEPDQALSTIEVAEGFDVELFAAEPLVADPTDMEIDEHGNFYVLENHGYPLEDDATSTVKLLRDTDGDNRPDESVVFADGLNMPTGIMRWKEGLLVTDAPDVLYFEDTDGDDRADVRKVVLTGFSFSNPQHNMSAPTYGLDNWVYLANEGSIGSEFWPEMFNNEGAEIRFPDREQGPRLPRNAGNQNVRFRPDRYQLEIVSGRSQFGQAFDTWGRHFLVHNTNIIYRAEIEARYLRRNPDLLVSDVMHTISDEGPMPKVFPITEDPEFAIFSDVGVITSASGLTLYLGDAFPERYYNVSFVGEPAHNLVHATRVSPSGVTFTAQRIPEDREFLASRDRWFRPVNFYVGPDGGLYMLDYYREYIEHPEWLSEDLHDSDALYNGKDRGRIYRIVPEDGRIAPQWGEDISLGSDSVEELVETLEHPNLWWRRTAQRLLVDRKDPAAVEPLKQLVHESSSAVGRLHALWTLEGLGALDSGLIRLALEDEAPEIRENAIKLAELHLDEAPELARGLIAMADEPDARVQFQLLCTLGELSDPEARRIHNRLLFENIDSPWMQVAGLTAADLDAGRLYRRALARLSSEETEGRQLFFRRVSSLVAARMDREQISDLVEGVLRNRVNGSVWWRAAALEGLAEGLESVDPDDEFLRQGRLFMVDAILETQSPDLRGAYLNVLDVLGLPEGPSTTRAFERATEVAASGDADPELRVDALRLLGMTSPSRHVDLFERMIRPDEPTPVQRTAVQNLVEVEGDRVGEFLLARWNSMTPTIRDVAMGAFLEEASRKRMLYDAIEAGQIEPSTIGWGYRVRLMSDEPDEKLRERARALLKRRTGARKEVVTEYEEALELPGDVGRGEEVFRRVCSRCHAKGEVEGPGFGPDLSSVRNRSKRWMLTQILMPNNSIADNYEQWIIERTSGETLSGVITSETATSVTVMNVAGEESTVSRDDIASMSATNVSAMPARLERQISPQQMADLLAFLKGE